MKQNPVAAMRYKQKGSVKAHIADTKAHYTAASTRVAQNAVDEVLRGNGKYLGSGNFGVAYEVNSDGRKRLVKMGSFDTIHSRGYAKHAADPEHSADMRRRIEEMAKKSQRTKLQMRNEMLHEAGIANELWALGYRCIPFTVFVERGLPALVREYGQLHGATVKQLDDLSLELQSIQDAGWNINDDLLIAKRIYDEDGAPKGSLFIADVGIWQWRGRPADIHDIRGLHGLLHKAFGFPSLAELQYYQQRAIKEEIKLAEKPENKFAQWSLRDSLSQIEKIKELRK